MTRYRVRHEDADKRPITGGITYPSDPVWASRLHEAGLAGPDAAAKARAEAIAAKAFKTVAAGEDCSDVPAQSIPWLLEQGYIEVVKPSAARAMADAIDAGISDRVAKEVVPKGRK